MNIRRLSVSLNLTQISQCVLLRGGPGRDRGDRRHKAPGRRLRRRLRPAARVPGASFTTADLEEPLPYPEGAFDVVTSFNSVQFATDPVAALKHMSHVTRPGGLISFLVWGPPDKCQSGVIFAELGPLMPPAPPAAPSSVAWSEDGQLEALAARAGLTALTVADVPNPLIYPDLATAVRTQLSSGPARNAIEHSGLPAVRGALTRAFAGSRTPDATYRQENIFRYLSPGSDHRACPAPPAPQRPHAPRPHGTGISKV